MKKPVSKFAFQMRPAALQRGDHVVIHTQRGEPRRARGHARLAGRLGGRDARRAALQDGGRGFVRRKQGGVAQSKFNPAHA